MRNIISKITVPPSNAIQAIWVVSKYRVSCCVKGNQQVCRYFGYLCFIVVVQSLSPVRPSATPWAAAWQVSVLHYLPSLFRFTSIESVMPSNHLVLCRPLLLLPSIFPSIRVLSSELALCILWPEYWSLCLTSSKIMPEHLHSEIHVIIFYYVTFLLFFHHIIVKTLCWSFNIMHLERQGWEGLVLGAFLAMTLVSWLGIELGPRSESAKS